MIFIIRIWFIVIIGIAVALFTSLVTVFDQPCGLRVWEWWAKKWGDELAWIKKR